MLYTSWRYDVTVASGCRCGSVCHDVKCMVLPVGWCMACGNPGDHLLPHICYVCRAFCPHLTYAIPGYASSSKGGAVRLVNLPWDGSLLPGCCSLQSQSLHKRLVHDLNTGSGSCKCHDPCWEHQLLLCRACSACGQGKAINCMDLPWRTISLPNGGCVILQKLKLLQT